MTEILPATSSPEGTYPPARADTQGRVGNGSDRIGVEGGPAGEERKPVLAAYAWPSNAELIEDVARIGYLRPHFKILDVTYGRGIWWYRWKPKPPGVLIGHSRAGAPTFDFRDLPYYSEQFDAVAFDPPYKLNGTDKDGTGWRYGVDEKGSIEARHQLIRDGMTEATRMLIPTHLKVPGGILMVKCQDQVCSGEMQWQTQMVVDHAESLGLRWVDEFLHLGGGRPQPERWIRFCAGCDRKLPGKKTCHRCPDGTAEHRERTRQQHAYQRPSSLLIFKRVKGRRAMLALDDLWKHLPPRRDTDNVTGKTYDEAFK